ncbi:uncharacterized protein LOC123554647 isoform X2 [Mercenaria mercenaria]|uniref:uncharacterized protein LOC123554647 isoform X2 n=1 Tax=Mercenaria mercenaria TaxID=6596 RepID=UPI00234E6F97|nr:uncharacterized protein LOC123554647 isoform X2 [Mercenaria mercenaria]
MGDSSQFRRLMEEDSPFRRLSLQEYPGRKYVLQPVNTSPVMPGSPVIPVRRRAAFSNPAPCNVQYEYLSPPADDDMFRKYSLEEYAVIDPQEQYGQNQSYFVEVPSPSYRPVQQVQPYYSMQAQQPVVQTRHQQPHLQTLQNVQTQPSQLQSQQPVQQIQLVRPIQQMQPGVEYVEYQPRRPASMQSFVPVTNPQTHSYSSEYFHGLTDIQEAKSPEIKKRVTFETPLPRMNSENNEVKKKEKIPTSEDTESIYEPYVGLKKAPAAIRKKNMREKEERLKEERFKENLKEEDEKEYQVEKVEKHDIGKIGRFNVQEVNISKKTVKENVESGAKGGNCITERRPRRHTVHSTHVDIYESEDEKKRRSAVCPMTAYNLSGSSTVAIDNKIEQAMDLVKSHLMFAVREEVEVLKEQIAELIERNNQLEYENGILRAAASPETLAKLSQPRQPLPSSSS